MYVFYEISYFYVFYINCVYHKVATDYTYIKHFICFIQTESKTEYS